MKPQNRRLRDPVVWLNAGPLMLLLTVFFVGPIVLTLLLTFQETEFYRLQWVWTLKTWTGVFHNPTYWTVIGRTLVFSLESTLLCLILAYPAAYAMATRLAQYNHHILILVVFAFLTDAVLKTFGWVLVLDRNGIGNWLLSHLGFGPTALDVLFTPQATLLGVVYNLSAYPLFTIYLSLARIDRDLMLAAQDAGAGRLRSFFAITLPLSKPGLLAGAVLVFVLSLGTFLESKVLGGGKSPLAPELIRQTFETRVNWPLGAALTTVLVVLASLAMAAMAWALLRQSRKGAAP